MSAEQSQNKIGVIKELVNLRKKIRKIQKNTQKAIEHFKAIKHKHFQTINAASKDLMSSPTSQIQLSQKYYKYFTEQEIKTLSQQNSHQSQQHHAQQKQGLKLQLTINGHKNLRFYWKNVFTQSIYGNYLTEFDRHLFGYIRHIQVTQNILSQEVAESDAQNSQFCSKQVCLSLIVSAGHHAISPGVYKRKMKFNGNGNPYKYDGDSLRVNRHRKIKRGIFKILFLKSEDCEHLSFLKEFLQVLREQLIPYSLQYYLNRKSYKNRNTNEDGSELRRHGSQIYSTFG